MSGGASGSMRAALSRTHSLGIPSLRRQNICQPVARIDHVRIERQRFAEGCFGPGVVRRMPSRQQQALRRIRPCEIGLQGQRALDGFLGLLRCTGIEGPKNRQFREGLGVIGINGDRFPELFFGVRQ